MGWVRHLQLAWRRHGSGEIEDEATKRYENSSSVEEIVSDQGKSTKHAERKTRGHERCSSGQVKHFLAQREDEFEAVSLTARVPTAKKHRREGLGTMVFHQTSKRR